MKSINRALVIVTLAALGIATAAPASAQEAAPVSTEPTGILRVGKLYSFGGGTDLQHGFGMDLRYQLYPERNMDGYIGLFSQGQYELGDAWRFDGGVTGGWGFFGLEVGISHRTATATYAGSTGLHIGQSLTFGPISIGGRLTIPLVDDVPQNVAVTPNVQGIEGAVTITLGWGFTVHGQRRASGCHGMHGH
jgi:hypothetical protein